MDVQAKGDGRRGDDGSGAKFTGGRGRANGRVAGGGRGARGGEGRGGRGHRVPRPSCRRRCELGRSCPYVREYQHRVEFTHDDDGDDGGGGGKSFGGKGVALGGSGVPNPAAPFSSSSSSSSSPSAMAAAAAAAAAATRRTVRMPPPRQQREVPVPHPAPSTAKAPVPSWSARDSSDPSSYRPSSSSLSSPPFAASAETVAAAASSPSSSSSSSSSPPSLASCELASRKRPCPALLTTRQEKRRESFRDQAASDRKRTGSRGGGGHGSGSWSGFRSGSGDDDDDDKDEYEEVIEIFPVDCTNAGGERVKGGGKSKYKECLGTNTVHVDKHDLIDTGDSHGAKGVPAATKPRKITTAKYAIEKKSVSLIESISPDSKKEKEESVLRMVDIGVGIGIGIGDRIAKKGRKEVQVWRRGKIELVAAEAEAAAAAKKKKNHQQQQKQQQKGKKKREDVVAVNLCDSTDDSQDEDNDNEDIEDEDDDDDDDDDVLIVFERGAATGLRSIGGGGAIASAGARVGASSNGRRALPLPSIHPRGAASLNHSSSTSSAALPSYFFSPSAWGWHSAHDVAAAAAPAPTETFSSRMARAAAETEEERKQYDAAVAASIRSIRADQDREYEESLRADRLKRIEGERREKAEADAKRKGVGSDKETALSSATAAAENNKGSEGPRKNPGKDSSDVDGRGGANGNIGMGARESATTMAEASKRERRRLNALERLNDEPDADDPDSATVAFRMPAGAKAMACGKDRNGGAGGCGGGGGVGVGVGVGVRVRGGGRVVRRFRRTDGENQLVLYLRGECSDVLGNVRRWTVREVIGGGTIGTEEMEEEEEEVKNTSGRGDGDGDGPGRTGRRREQRTLEELGLFPRGVVVVRDEEC